jgi:hypothetical protein
MNHFGGLKHLVRSRGGKDFPGTGGIEHPYTDKTTVHGFMATSPTRDDSYLLRYGSVSPVHKVGIKMHLEQLRVGNSHSHQAFTYDIFWLIDQLFHIYPPRGDRGLLS